jgi:hypothetical protein
VDDLLFDHCLAEHIMAMPAAQRRWTAHEVRQLIAENPLQTPRAGAVALGYRPLLRRVFEYFDN